MNSSTPSSQWPDVARVVWLAGGVVAYNNPGPDVEICAGGNGRLLHKMRIAEAGYLLYALRMHKFHIIGVTFVQHQEEVDRVRPAEFRMSGLDGGWPLWNTWEKWRQVAFHSSRRDDMVLFDLASRIASGIEYAQSRLHDLAVMYSVQLRACLHDGKSFQYRAFKDLNSRDVYKCIHALFWELAVLRDTLVEFAALFCFGKSSIKTVRGLLAHLRSSGANDPLAEQFFSITDESRAGWMSRFTCYRNFFTHVAPMEQATGSAFTILDTRSMSGNVLIPQIYYPLPRDIEKLTRERSKGKFYPTFKMFAQASKGRRDRAFDPDALEYLHGCLSEFVELATTLVARSPIPATPIRLGPEDIIGGITVHTNS